MTSLRERFRSESVMLHVMCFRYHKTLCEEKRVRNLMEKEDRELELMVVERRKQKPKTLEEFKHSLNFILPRHIKRYEVLVIVCLVLCR